MKKNVMMRVASVLLVAVMLTTCVISGTFAKYVTDATGSDTARVAKWGVTVTASGTTFAEKYNDAADVAGVKVVSTEKVVAPGTYGSLANVEVAGTPEVMVTVTYEATLTLTGFDTYCPLVFTVNGVTYATADVKAVTPNVVCTDAADLATKVSAAIVAVTNTYGVGTDLSTVNDDLGVSWSWAFEGNDDSKDTSLGDEAANENAATITLTVKTIVTQEN